MTKTTVARILHYLGPVISVAAGWLTTYLFLHVPQLASFETKQQVATFVVGALVFVVTTGLTYITHNKVVQQILKDLGVGADPVPVVVPPVAQIPSQVPKS